MEQIKEKLIQMLRNSGKVSEDLLIDSESILADFGMNSVTFIGLIVMIENEFDFEVDDADLDLNKFKTINDLVVYIKSKSTQQ